MDASIAVPCAALHTYDFAIQRVDVGMEGAVTAYTVTSTSQFSFCLIAHSRLSVSKKHHVLLPNWPLIGQDFGSATVTCSY
jgi:hypothetical protein